MMRRMADNPYTLSPTAAAERLGVHVDTIKRWARAGKIPAWRTPGGWWRFSPADLDDVFTGTDGEAA